jgi:hypothetical protein
MIDLKTTTEIAKRFVLPTLLALLIFGVPLGYQYFNLQKERNALAVTLEKKKAELDAINVSREAELDKKADTLSAKEAEMNAMADQLKKSLTLLDQREREYQAALAKLQQEQILAHQKVKQAPLKRAVIQQPKRAASIYRKKAPPSGTRLKKPVEAKAFPPAEASPPPIAPPPAVKLVESLPQARPPGACASAEGGPDAAREIPRLKRKFSATRFSVNYRPADLIPNIRSGLPEDLLRRLGENDGVLPRNVSLGIEHPPLQAQSDSLSNTDAARDVAYKTGSQFILSGVIDAGIGRTDYGRWIEVEIDAYDGLSGARVAKRRQGMEIAGESEIEIRSLFGTAQFFNTPFGRRFDALMESLVKGIRSDLACMPFTAKITDIDIGNNKIYIDAGATSLVAPGDKFVAYHSARRVQSESATNGLLGAPTMPVASLTIRQVFPLFSIGELSIDPKKAALQAGDFISAQKIHWVKQK